MPRDTVGGPRGPPPGQPTKPQRSVTAGGGTGAGARTRRGRARRALDLSRRRRAGTARVPAGRGRLAAGVEHAAGLRRGAGPAGRHPHRGPHGWRDPGPAAGAGARPRVRRRLLGQPPLDRGAARRAGSGERRARARALPPRHPRGRDRDRLRALAGRAALHRVLPHSLSGRPDSCAGVAGAPPPPAAPAHALPQRREVPEPGGAGVDRAAGREPDPRAGGGSGARRRARRTASACSTPPWVPRNPARSRCT